MDKKDLEEFAAAVQDRFNNPFVDHELMSISLNSTSKWKARNLPSLLEYVEKTGRLPECLSMSLAAYIAFYTSDVQELTEAGLVCRRAKGNTYICSDDRWALEFYWAHKDDSAADLVHAVLTNRQMWDQGPDGDRGAGSRGAGGAYEDPRGGRGGRVRLLPVRGRIR